MQISTHAKARMKSRGIAPEDINLILDYGDSAPRPGAATEIYLHKEQVKALIKRYRTLVAVLEKIQGKAVLLSQDGTIITTYRKH